MPVLLKAREVVVLSLEGWGVDGPSGEELARCLERHRIKAEPVTWTTRSRSVGEAILDYASSVGSDLLIKGAYTQSRLRQMIFGGPTSHILAHANVPVFMAH
jgi:nucleotide-binding universal stress UspA family protein